MRKVGLLGCLLIFTILFAMGINYAVSAEEQARICAERSLDFFRGTMEAYYNEFNFSSEEDAKIAELGTPIPRFNISNLDLYDSLICQAKPATFYVFPLMVDGKPVSDLTVVLENGEWKRVDVGGNLCRTIYDVSEREGLNVADTKILGFAGETFVMVPRDGKEYGYIPFYDDLGYGLESKKLVSSDQLKAALVKKAEKMIKVNDSLNPEQGLSGNLSTTEAAQFRQENVFLRLVNYIRFMLIG